MRLVLATPLYPPELGGPATYTKILEEGLPKHGIEVSVVKFGDVRKLPKLLRHIAYYRRVLEAAREADAVLALDPVSTGLPALAAAKKAGKPFFVKVVGDYAWEQGTQRFGVTASLDEFVRTKEVPFLVQRLREVQKKVAMGATRVLVPSQYLKGIVETWGVPSEKIAVAYNSIALEEGGTVPAVVAARPRPHIVTVGRLVPWKNMDQVMDAVARLGAGTLVLAGEGPERANLEAHAERVLPEAIFTGALSHADTLALLKDADAFVLNSTYEGLSHLLIEALSLGTPVIATRAGGNVELVEDGVNGILIPVGDVEALSAALTRVTKPEPGVTETFAKRFAPEAMLKTTAEILSTP